jgi:hypothetical protein
LLVTGVLAWRRRSRAPLVLAALAGAGSIALTTLIKDMASRTEPR